MTLKRSILLFCGVFIATFLVLYGALAACAPEADAQIPTVMWVGDSSNEHWVSEGYFDGHTYDEIAYGKGGDDVLEGHDGFDDLHGGRGKDILKGGAGSDWVEGGTGRDRLNGGLGPDVLYALDGNRDWIECGSGRDVLVADAWWDESERRWRGLDEVAPSCEGPEPFVPDHP